MRNVIATAGGINWCWYVWFELDEGARLAHKVRDERFHRFNEAQGAGRHPTADCIVAYWHAPEDTPERRATWSDTLVDQWIADWRRNLTAWELPPDTTTVVELSGIGKFALVP